MDMVDKIYLGLAVCQLFVLVGLYKLDRSETARKKERIKAFEELNEEFRTLRKRLNKRG